MWASPACSTPWPATGTHRTPIVGLPTRSCRRSTSGWRTAANRRHPAGFGTPTTPSILSIASNAPGREIERPTSSRPAGRHPAARSPRRANRQSPVRAHAGANVFNRVRSASTRRSRAGPTAWASPARRHRPGRMRSACCNWPAGTPAPNRHGCARTYPHALQQAAQHLRSPPNTPPRGRPRLDLFAGIAAPGARSPDRHHRQIHQSDDLLGEIFRVSASVAPPAKVR